MSDDDETTDSNDATPANESATTSPASGGERHTVHIPQWLAGALVVVLALLIGAVGYAIGASSNDNDGPSFRPINASQQQGGQQGGQGGGFPGGPGGQQGGPQAGPGGQQGPGGPQGGPGGGPSFDNRGERGDRQGEDDQDSQDDDSNNDDQDEDANY